MVKNNVTRKVLIVSFKGKVEIIKYFTNFFDPIFKQF